MPDPSPRLTTQTMQPAAAPAPGTDRPAKPPRVAPRKRKVPTPVKLAIRVASLAGFEDNDLAAQHKVPAATIRNWRSDDPEWSAAYHELRKGEKGGKIPKAHIALTERRRQTALANPDAHPATRLHYATPSPETPALPPLLPEIAARNHVRVAVIMDRALEKVEKRKRPLPINTVHEAAAAYKTLRVSTGCEDEAGPALTVNLWGTGASGAIGPNAAPAFREVTPPRKAIATGD